MRINVGFSASTLNLGATCTGCGLLTVAPVEIPSEFIAIVGMVGAVIDTKVEGGLGFELPGGYLCPKCTAALEGVQAQDQPRPNLLAEVMEVLDAIEAEQAQEPPARLVPPSKLIEQEAEKRARELARKTGDPESFWELYLVQAYQELRDQIK